MWDIVWDVLCWLPAAGGWILASIFGLFVYLRRDKVKADGARIVSLENKILVLEQEIKMKDGLINAINREREYWKQRQTWGVIQGNTK
jgi:hypothetical protein